MSVSLSCQGLEAGYGRIIVCRDIDLNVAQGELVAILGPNGAGKSTLLRGLAGLNQKAGTVRLDGQDISRKGAASRATSGIAFVPESRGNIFASMTVGENLAVAGRRTPTDRRADRDELIAQLFPVLERFNDRQAGLLSGGEQQMLAIGMALMADPSVILLDEPSQGLAPSVLRDIELSLTTLRSTGITIVLAEQNQRFAAALADRILHLVSGHLVSARVTAEAYDADTTIDALH